jgi:hypothetical protein
MWAQFSDAHPSDKLGFPRHPDSSHHLGASVMRTTQNKTNCFEVATVCLN